MHDDVGIGDLQSRFAQKSRGRTVQVRLEPKDSPLAFDFQVRFDEGTSFFDVVFETRRLLRRRITPGASKGS